jgi:hypothetical protein
VTYTKTQLLQILNQAVVGSGSCHRAPVDRGEAQHPGEWRRRVSGQQHDRGGRRPDRAWVVPPIGSGFLSPSSTNTKTQTLDDYNNGITGPGHCGDTPSQSTTWGRIKTLYR